MSFSIRTSIAASISLLALASAVAQADPVTFDFTGLVTGVDGFNGQVSLSETVTGTLTFNVVSADLVPGSGPIGSNNWAVFRVPVGPTFLMSAQVGSFSYDSAGIYPDSIGAAAATSSTSYNVYSAGEGHLWFESTITLQTPYGSPLPWDSNGLPVPTNTFDAGSGGQFSDGTTAEGGGVVEFQFTSISLPPAAAPEIDPADAASGLTLLLGSLLVLRGRRPSKRVTA